MEKSRVKEKGRKKRMSSLPRILETSSAHVPPCRMLELSEPRAC